MSTRDLFEMGIKAIHMRTADMCYAVVHLIQVPHMRDMIQDFCGEEGPTSLT